MADVIAVLAVPRGTLSIEESAITGHIELRYNGTLSPQMALELASEETSGPSVMIDGVTAIKWLQQLADG